VWRVVGLALLLIVSGCASDTPIGTPTADVRIGTCKNKTTAEEMVSFSDVSPAVPCAKPHTLETFFVAALPSTISSLGPTRPGPEIMSAQSTGACPADKVRSYLGATALDTSWGVDVFMKFPTRAEWATGERRIVCDLAISTYEGAAPQMDVPLRDIMRFTDSARVRQCRIHLADYSEIITCDNPHSDERVGNVDLADTADEQHTGCAAMGRRYVKGVIPADFTVSVTKTTGEAQCWLTKKNTKISRGTLRGGLRTR
jgi:hypothetical protein